MLNSHDLWPMYTFEFTKMGKMSFKKKEQLGFLSCNCIEYFAGTLAFSVILYKLILTKAIFFYHFKL